MKNIYYLAFLTLILTASGCVTYETRPERHSEVVATSPVYVTGQVVTTLPEGYRLRVYHGTTYYTYNNLYYRTAPNGYVIVERPW